MRFLRDHDRIFQNTKETISNSKSSRNKHTKIKLYTFLARNVARPRGDHRKPCDTVPNVADAYEPDVGILLNGGCESNFAQRSSSCPNLVAFRRPRRPSSCLSAVAARLYTRSCGRLLSAIIGERAHGTGSPLAVIVIVYLLLLFLVVGSVGLHHILSHNAAVEQRWSTERSHRPPLSVRVNTNSHVAGAVASSISPLPSLCYRC